jgi:hypothetical protein
MFSQPAREQPAAGIGTDRLFERPLVVRIIGRGVDVCAGSEESFGCPSLATVAGLPERVVHILLGWRRGCGEQLLEPTEHPEGCGVPERVDRRASLNEEPGHMPAAVADGVVEWGADRPAGVSRSAPPSMSTTATSTSSLLAAQCSGVSGQSRPVSSFGSVPASRSRATAAGAAGK